MEEVYKTLKELGIDYSVYRHKAVYTVEEANKEIKDIEGADTKNLFLRNEKGRRNYLVIVPAEERVNLKDLAKHLNERRLSFASPERLQKYLGVTPGSVSPFGLINDKESEVSVLIKKELVEEKKLGFHPNKNTATVVVKKEDFQKFLNYCGNSVYYF